jgi:mRNA-degrading endonuclease RelE of RelBE toxin-antitoxin system
MRTQAELLNSSRSSTELTAITSPCFCDSARRAGEWRVRTGDYRVIYKIHDDRLIVLVLRVGHGRDIYESR